MGMVQSTAKGLLRGAVGVFTGAGDQKGYTETGRQEYLESIRPARAPDATDLAVQAAAREARVQTGRNRRSTFLTGPGSASDSMVRPRTLLGGR